MSFKIGLKFVKASRLEKQGGIPIQNMYFIRSSQLKFIGFMFTPEKETRSHISIMIPMFGWVLQWCCVIEGAQYGCTQMMILRKLQLVE